jgi:thioredoxin
MVLEITDIKQIPQDKKVLIDFHAVWCGPCKTIGPAFVAISQEEKYKDIVFLKVDVDEAEKIAESFNISSLPTFLFLNNGNEWKQVIGANVNELKTNLDNLYVFHVYIS